MAGALSLLLTVCLLPGVFSAFFQIFMPEKIEAVAGTCVTIPCSFEIEPSYQSHLDRTCLAIWKRDGRSDATSKFLTLPTTQELKHKICTSTMINAQIVDSGRYYFTLQCKNILNFYFAQSVEIQVKDDSPQPTLSPSVLDVVEGASVSLQCSAPAPCPPLYPTVTWTPSLGTSQETLRNNTDKTEVLISVMKFTASHLHHGQTFYCTASYKKQDKSSVSVISSPLTANIKYQPRNILVSVQPFGPVREGTDVELRCSGDANPAVNNYRWFSCDPDCKTFIANGPYATIKAANTRVVTCRAKNDVGAGWSNQTIIEVQYQPRNIEVSVSPSSPVREDTDVVLKCSSDASPPVTNYRWYSSGPERQTLIHTGPDFTIKASRNTGALLCMAENNVGTGWSIKTNIDVEFAPQILANCVQAASTVSCSCWTVGNPPPMLQWRLDGLPVNLDKANISSEAVNATGQRSTITINLLQGLNLSTLLCHSSNSVGSARRQIHVYTFEDQKTTPGQGQRILFALVSTAAILLLFVGVLLFIIRSRKTRSTVSTLFSVKPLPGGNDEVQGAIEMDVYTNTTH